MSKFKRAIKRLVYRYEQNRKNRLYTAVKRVLK